MDGDTHKTLTPVSSHVLDKDSDDKRNCTSLPLYYDPVS